MLSARIPWWLLLPGVLCAQPAAVPSAPWVQDALTHALAACEEIADPFHRAQVLAEVGQAQAAAGDTAIARETLKSAATVAAGIREMALLDYAQRDIAVAYLKAGMPEEAEALAETLKDSRLRDAVLAGAADARRSAHDLAGALATARRIRGAGAQGRALRLIALLQVTEMDFQGALATARSIQHAGLNALALSDVAAAIARDGSFEEATQLTARIRDPLSRARAFEEVAIAQAAAGRFQGALATLERVEDKLQRAEGIARVAELRAPPENRKLFEQALAIAVESRGPPFRRADVLTEIARAQIGSGDAAGARATLKRVFDQLRRVKEDDDRLNLFSRMAPLQARAGDFAGAFATAMRAEDGSLRPLLVRDIAAYQAERGDVEGAVALARALDDRASAAAALFGILRTQYQARDARGIPETLDAILQTVRLIPSPELRAAALGSLAAARISTGDVEAAHAAFTEAMNAAAAAERGSQQATVYARIADALADRRQ